MSQRLQDEDRAEQHAQDNVLNDDAHNLEEEKAQYKIGSSLAHRVSLDGPANFLTDNNEEEGVDKSNIINSRTRAAGKASGQYQEPEEGNIEEDNQGNAYLKDQGKDFNKS